MKIFHTNMRSINGKINLLEALIADKDPDVLCITEHWRKENEIQGTQLTGYRLVSFSARTKPGGGGTAVFVKNTLDFKDFNVLNVSKVSCAEKCFEFCTIRSNSFNLNILTIYRCPSGDFDMFLSSLEGVLSEIILHNRQTVLAGDFNVNFLKNKDSKTNKLLDVLTSFNLKQTIFEPTRGENCLDNIFVESENVPNSARVLNTGFSDHKAQIVECPITKINAGVCQNNFICRPITQKGMLNFFNRVSDIDWSFLNEDGMNVDEKCCYFMNELEEAYLVSFPIKNYKVRSDHGQKISWFTEELWQMREQLHFLEELSKQYSTPDILNSFKDFKKQYKNAIHLAKIKSNDNLIESSSNPTRTMWSIINNQRGKCKAEVTANISPTEFNNYFSQIAQNLVKDIPILERDPVQNIKNNNSPKFQFSHVTFNQVRDIINSLKNKKSKDVYGLSVPLIKSVKNILIIPLTKLINLCFVENVFPSVLKRALVTPIFKKGDSDNPENYRPISLLPIISKVFEKCISQQICCYFEENNLFTESQFGFRSKKSTVSGILDLVSCIWESFHRLQFNGAVFCDLSKAFDCVNHGILLGKLNNYNFSPESVKLINSYVRDRSQVVRIGGVSSEETFVNIGVPQGSVLGPLLFLIFINDLPDSGLPEKYTLFADDTTISFAADSLQAALEGSMVAQLRAEEWFCMNKLLLNSGKTNKMIFSMREDEQINQDLRSVRFLGVHLDPRLQWGAHIDEVSRRLGRNLFVLRSLAQCVSPTILKTAYFALFHTHLSYALLVWGHSAESSRVFSLQRKALRVLAGLRYRDDCRQAFIHLQILTFPSQYILENLIFIKQSGAHFRSHEDVHNYNTRNKKNLVVPYWRLKRCQSGPGYWSVKFFNALPENIKKLPMKEYKRKIKIILLQNAFYSFDEFLRFEIV